jgi:hypothetical protein
MSGAEPRYPMRLDPQVGQEATMQMRMDMAMAMVVDGEVQPTGELSIGHRHDDACAGG